MSQTAQVDKAAYELLVLENTALRNLINTMLRDLRAYQDRHVQTLDCITYPESIAFKVPHSGEEVTITKPEPELDPLRRLVDVADNIIVKR